MIKRVERPKTNPGQPVARPRRGRITGAVNVPHRPADPASARRDEEAETARLMNNWAHWKAGVSISVAVSSAFNLEARGRREAVSVPLLNGEAADVDAAVDALPRELHQVVVMHWLGETTDHRGKPRKMRAATIEQRAQACSCAVATYYRRLEHAHARIRALMRGKRAQAERARELYRAKGIVDKPHADA